VYFNGLLAERTGFRYAAFIARLQMVSIPLSSRHLVQ
jgi:hypothetical protein